MKSGCGWTSFGAGLALSALMLSCGTVRAHVMWLHEPGVGSSGDAGSIVADLDADGRPEAIASVTLGPGVSSGLVVIADAGNGLRQEQLLLVDGLLRADLVPVAHPDGARIIALVQPRDGVFDYSMVEFAGRPLRGIRRVALPQHTRPLAVADVNADGTLDVVAITGPYPEDGSFVTILDYASFDTLWIDGLPGTSAIVAQLDADAALEIVVDGMPGRVIDGASRLQDWSYAAGFGSLLAMGEFDANLAGPELGMIGGEPRFPLFTIFRSAPLSPWRELEVPYATRGMTVHDLDGDGTDELLLTSLVPPEDVQILTPSTGAARTLELPGFRATKLAAGDLTGAASSELVLLDGDNYQATIDHLRIVDGDSGVTLLSLQRTYGPYAALTATDLDGDGMDEVIHTLQRVIPGAPSHTHCVLDGRTGRERACGRSAADWIESAPIAGRFNDTPGNDLVMLGSNGVTALDGATLSLLWRRGDISSYAYPFADTGTVRFNDDAYDDIVLLGSNAKLRVLDGYTGATLWESVSVGSVFDPARLAIADVDDDPATELVVATGRKLFVFDASTRLLEWSMQHDRPIDRLLAWGTGDACRLGLYTSTGAFSTLRCDDRSLAVPDRALPAEANALHVLAPDGSQLLVAAAGRVQTVGVDDSVRVWSPFLGNALGLGNVTAILPRSANRHDVIIGSDGGVARVRVDFDLMFLDTFD